VESKMVKVKICGLTNLEDAQWAAKCGADALGFILSEKGPRFIEENIAASITSQLPPFVSRVGVFVDEEIETVKRIAVGCRLDYVQLHGDESPDYCDKLRDKINCRIIKAFQVKGIESLEGIKSYFLDSILLDAWSPEMHGGCGVSFDWKLALDVAKNCPIILAGGLNPKNVADAVRQVQPFAVDVSSGVQFTARQKDKEKVLEFIREAKGILGEED
jgi:phosphoribosylanthranilate isomerase